MKGRPKNAPGALSPRMRQCLDLIGDAGVDGIGSASLAGRMGCGLATICTYTHRLQALGLVACTGGRASVWRLKEPRKAMAIQMAMPVPSVWAFAQAIGCAA